MWKIAKINMNTAPLLFMRWHILSSNQLQVVAQQHHASDDRMNHITRDVYDS